jgi:hypothetical protein
MKHRLRTHVRTFHREPARLAAGAGFALWMTLLAACGGAGNPLGNPDDIANEPLAGARKLSFVYFQNCINPIFLAQLTIQQGGQTSVNSCAAAGCHDDTNGTGGAFRVRPAATTVDLATTTADAARQTDMYTNFYSAQGEVVFTAPLDSRLLAKPLVRGVLHGGGLIFENEQDENVRRIQYWITQPMPQGQDEFSSAANAMFASGTPSPQNCNTP